MTSSFCHNGKKNSNVYTERSFNVYPTKVSLNLFQHRDFIFFFFLPDDTKGYKYRKSLVNEFLLNLYIAVWVSNYYFSA